MAWEENSHICLHMQLIAILSRIEVILNRETLFVMSMLCGYAAYILSSYYLTTTLRVVPSESLRMLMPLTGAETSEPSAA